MKNLNGPFLFTDQPPVVRKIKVAVVAMFDAGCGQALQMDLFLHLERRADRRQFDCVSY